MTWRALMGAGARPFRDRRDAGRRLAERLRPFADEDPVVVGLPRGGVPVAWEVARALGAPLDVVLVRKVGCPFQPELGVGALGEDGALSVDERALRSLGLTEAELEPVIRDEREVLERRAALYRGSRRPIDVTGRTVLLVDDGIATGGTVRVAAEILRRRAARRVVVAVPVGPPGVEERLGAAVDEVICLEQPPDYFAVGQVYEEFGPTGDDEVAALLEGAWSPIAHREVVIGADGLDLAGDLRSPADPRALVAFAHGSGSSRLSPRNVQVATALAGRGFATLLFDLLSAQEATDRNRVFDIPLLAERLIAATDRVRADPQLAALPLGYFGASTGAAAALGAAAQRPEAVGAVVSRGGRPDLAEAWLGSVEAPTLLIVGGADPQVLDLNRTAAARLRCPHELAIVEGATHLFEEPGALERVTELTAGWFTRHLARRRASAA